MTIYNLTQHNITAEQKSAGVVELNEICQGEVRAYLTFTAIPSKSVLQENARKLVASLLAYHPEARQVLIGGAPFFMSALEQALKSNGVEAVYAFTQRTVEEKDGIKKSVFKHEGFIPAYRWSKNSFKNKKSI